MSHPPRKPSFLAGVPEQPLPQAPRFSTPGARPIASSARAVSGHAPHGPHVVHEAAAAPPPPDLGEIRREAMERLAGALATLRAQADHLAEQARCDAVEIGFQVARKILEAELRHNTEAIFSLVRSAVRRAGESRRITVRVSPDDLAVLQATDAPSVGEGISAARIEYVSDTSLQRGDCVVEADFGQVDGRLSTRLQELRRAVDAVAEEDFG